MGGKMDGSAIRHSENFMNKTQGACSQHPEGCPEGSHRSSNQKLRVIEPYRSKDGVTAEVYFSKLGGTGAVVIEADTGTGEEAEVVLSMQKAHDLMLWLRCALGMNAVETKALNAAMTQEMQRAEWRHIHSVLREAQQRIQADGVRHSWMDGAIGIAEARAKGEGLSEEPEGCRYPMSYGKRCDAYPNCECGRTPEKAAALRCSHSSNSTEKRFSDDRSK